MYGLGKHFQINSIEGILGKIKKLTQSFNCLYGKIFYSKKTLDEKDYFEDGYLLDNFSRNANSLIYP